MNPFREMYLQELSAKQKKIDKNKNNKIDGEDLAHLRREETEELDELSKTTLTNYISKAAGAVARLAHSAAGTQHKYAGQPISTRPDDYDSERKKANSRVKNIGKAAGKLSKEEVELDEGEVKDAIDAHRRTRMSQMSQHSTDAREKAHKRSQERLDKGHERTQAYLDSMQAASVHGHKERMAQDTHDTKRRKESDADTTKTMNVLRDRLKNRKSKNEEVEIDEKLTVGGGAPVKGPHGVVSNTPAKKPVKTTINKTTGQEYTSGGDKKKPEGSKPSFVNSHEPRKSDQVNSAMGRLRARMDSARKSVKEAADVLSIVDEGMTRQERERAANEAERRAAAIANNPRIAAEVERRKKAKAAEAAKKKPTYALGSYNVKEEADVLEGAVPDHMKGKQKPYVSSDGKGNYEVLGNTGQTKAEFSRKEHGQDAHKKAQSHLRTKYNEYMKEELEFSEGINLKSKAHALAAKLTSNSRTSKAEYHSDGSASIHHSPHPMVSTATQADNAIKNAGGDHNNSEAALKNHKQTIGDLKVHVKKTNSGHTTHISESILEANHREFASQGKMHPDMAKHMKTGEHMDYYEPKTGDKVHGKVMKNDGKEVHVKQTHDSYDPKKKGAVHKFTVSTKLDEKKEDPPFDGPYTKVTGNTKDKSGAVHTPMSRAKHLAQQAAIAIAKKKVKEEFDMDITTEQALELLEAVKKQDIPAFLRKARGDKPLNLDDLKKNDSLSDKNNLAKARGVKEEVEELDELSKSTIGSYVKKAKSSLIGSSQVMGMGSKTTGQKTHDKAEKKVQKRASGINKAVDRLTKEETMYIVENDYDEAENYKDKANAAKEKGDMYNHHIHMSNHHDSMADWHDSKGRESHGDSQRNKAHEHRNEARKLKMKENIEMNSFKSYMQEDLDEALWPGTPEYKKKFGADRGVVGTSSKTAKGTQTVTKTGVKHERDYEASEKDDKPESGEKRGRGRPKGAASGARQKGSAAKADDRYDSTGFKLHLPNKNR